VAGRLTHARQPASSRSRARPAIADFRALRCAFRWWVCLKALANPMAGKSKPPRRSDAENCTRRLSF